MVAHAFHGAVVPLQEEGAVGLGLIYRAYVAAIEGGVKHSTIGLILSHARVVTTGKLAELADIEGTASHLVTQEVPVLSDVQVDACLHQQAHDGLHALLEERRHFLVATAVSLIGGPEPWIPQRAQGGPGKDLQVVVSHQELRPGTSLLVPSGRATRTWMGAPRGRPSGCGTRLGALPLPPYGRHLCLAWSGRLPCIAPVVRTPCAICLSPAVVLLVL